MGPRVRIRCLGAAAALVWCGAIAAQPSAPQLGERLYREGLLASGEAVRGERQGAPPLVGHDAACAHCHRRSGLGTVEGRIVIPPISGPYLFHPGERVGRGGAQPTGRVQDPKAYDEAKLARAIRDGIGSDGRRLDYLMPRFRIDDDSMRELIAYLKGLSSGPQRGAGPDVLDFATIVTPDADPVARDAMLEVIEKFFANRNAFYHGDQKAPPLQSARRIHFRVERRWQLCHIPVVAERVQGDTYIASAVVAEALHEMIDDLLPEYLIERLKAMLRSRVVNGYYMRLSLAPGQRFASKGGYLARLVAASGAQVAGDGDWIVP